MKMKRVLRIIVAATLGAMLSACGAPWNSPYPPAQNGRNIYYTSFAERPKHLDPVQAYSENEYALIAQIYAPPLQYHYLKRPYELIPFAATSVPQPSYFGKQGELLAADAASVDIAYSLYTIELKPGMQYQPHPALARDTAGQLIYETLSERELEKVHELRDFKHTGTREVVAADYVYQIKRLAHPRLHSPILGLMSEYIEGLKEYAERLQEDGKNVPSSAYLDLNRHEIAGVKAIGPYTFTIRIKGNYPQFAYWLAMPFFVPVPVEADRFYSKPGMAARNLSFDWYPLGSGPYMLTVNNPNRQMVLERNPHYMDEHYPSEGETGDAEAGLLTSAGKPLPSIDTVIYSLEKEAIPSWNKFLQGYYDGSGITSDNFDRVVELSGTGDPSLTDDMRAQGIQLRTSVAPSTTYIGFNMLDPVVGGDSERARKLRQAVSIAFDVEEWIAIFLNGRGVAAQGPIAPGLFGYLDGQAGLNSVVYRWENGAPERHALTRAKQLLAEAGYPGGVDAATGRPLMLHFDMVQGGAQGKAMIDWLVKQFKKIDIDLDVRATDYNRFQDKMRKGKAQIFRWGWNADYPDPENFLFLLYGPQSKVKADGQNAANYASSEFDRLFEQMRDMTNSPERQGIINKMVDVLRHDAPWIWGIHPKEYGLAHQWIGNRKPNKLANNGMKYLTIDVARRQALRTEWNQPARWPMALITALLVGFAVLVVRVHRQREQVSATQEGHA